MGHVTSGRGAARARPAPTLALRRSRGRPAHPAYPGLPARRPRDVRGFVGAVLLAMVLGLATGLSPGWTGLVVLGLPAALVLLLRVELAALTIVAAASFELDLVEVVPGLGTALLALLVGAWGLRRLRAPLHAPGRSVVVGTLLALLVVLLVAYLVEPDSGTDLDPLLRSVGLATFALVLVEVLRGPLAPRVVALVHLLGSSLAAATGVLVAVVHHEPRVDAPVGDPDTLAFVLLTAVPFALALRTTLRRPWLADVALGTVLAGLAGTRSPVALLGLAVVLAVAAATRQAGMRAVATAGAVLLVGVGIAASVAPDLVRTVAGRDGAIRNGLSERLDLWRATATAAVDGPVGALRLLVLVALVALVVAALAAAWSRWRTDGDPVAAAVFLALVGTVVAATYADVHHALVLWVLVALAAALPLQPAGPGREQP